MVGAHPFTSGRDDEQPRQSKTEYQSGAHSGSFNQNLLIAAIPAIIALCGTIWLATRGTERESQVKIRERVDALGTDIIQDSADVVNSLRKVRKLAVNKSYAEIMSAKPEYDKARDTWYARQVKYRMLAKSIGNGNIADLINVTSNKNLVVDSCYVLIRRYSKRRNTSCTARLKREVTILTEAQDAANLDQPYDIAKSGIIAPSDFTTSLRVVNSYLERVIDCKEPQPTVGISRLPSVKERCPNIKYLEYALNLRVNLLGSIQESLPDKLTAR